jgi:hypothetical protein
MNTWVPMGMGMCAIKEGSIYHNCAGGLTQAVLSITYKSTTSACKQPMLPHHNHCATCATMQHHTQTHITTSATTSQPLCYLCYHATPPSTPHRHTITTSATTSQPLCYLCYHATPPSTPHRHTITTSATTSQPLCYLCYHATPPSTPHRHTITTSAQPLCCHITTIVLPVLPCNTTFTSTPSQPVLPHHNHCASPTYR